MSMLANEGGALLERLAAFSRSKGKKTTRERRPCNCTSNDTLHACCTFKIQRKRLCALVNPVFVPLKQRYSTEASLQHGNLRDPPPGRLPQQVRGDGQQQLCAHQRWRQGLRQAEEKHPDVRRAGAQKNPSKSPNNLSGCEI